MNKTAPHYLLLTQAKTNSDSMCSGGIWRFVLEQLGSSNRIEVAEEEPGCWGERLQLLAVVRGLEALDQPSRVTLITPSRVVGNGIRRGLVQWRINGWQWEDCDQQTPIENCDLWKRVDQALQYHHINCRIWDFDESVVRKSRRSIRNRISFGEIENARRLLFADANESNQDSDISGGEPQAANRLDPFQASSAAQRIRRVDIASALSCPVETGTSINVKPIGAGRAFGYVPN